jgi:uncharacterized protein YjgD (DUF1641 family)
MIKQTAVEYLVNELTPSIALQQKHIDELKEKAKEMEKQQIIDAYQNGRSDQQSDVKSIFYNTNAEIYYNDTFNI